MPKGERDYASSPAADALGLRSIIDGLASDLQDMRNGRISPAQAIASATVAKQIFNGVRLYLQAHQLAKANHAPAAQPDENLIEGRRDE